MPPPWRPRPSTRRPTTSRSVALEEAKGTLLAYDNIAVAEGPHPRKAYIQARDIQDAHKQFHILPDGPQIPKPPVGPLNPDPIDEKAPPGVTDRSPSPYQPGPAGPLGPRPNSLPPYTPAAIAPVPLAGGPCAGIGSAGRECRPALPPTDVSLTVGCQPARSVRRDERA